MRLRNPLLPLNAPVDALRIHSNEATAHNIDMGLARAANCSIYKASASKEHALESSRFRTELP